MNFSRGKWLMDTTNKWRGSSEQNQWSSPPVTKGNYFSEFNKFKANLKRFAGPNLNGVADQNGE